MKIRNERKVINKNCKMSLGMQKGNVFHSLRRNAWDLQVLGDNPESRGAVENADIVIGFDRYSEGYSFFYGQEALKEISLTGKPKKLNIVSFKLDYKTEELEYLIAAVQVLKGSCSYGVKY